MYKNYILNIITLFLRTIINFWMKHVKCSDVNIIGKLIFHSRSVHRSFRRSLVFILFLRSFRFAHSLRLSLRCAELLVALALRFACFATLTLFATLHDSPSLVLLTVLVRCFGRGVGFYFIMRCVPHLFWMKWSKLYITYFNITLVMYNKYLYINT